MAVMRGIMRRMSSFKQPTDKTAGEETEAHQQKIIQNLPPKEKNKPINYRFFTKQKKAAPPVELPKPKRPSVIIHHPPWKVPALNDPFPNLEGATQGNPNFNLYEYKGSNWAMVFTHPVDFTPVCTSEFVELLKLKPEFEACNIKIVGFSTNDSVTHCNWLMDVEAIVNGYPTDQDPAFKFPTTAESTASTVTKLSDSATSSSALRVDFPIYSDPTLEMAVELGILDEDVKDEDGLPVTARSVYVLTPDNKIALISTYPTTLGRNWREILRCIQALQVVDRNNGCIHIPSHWEKGDEVLIDPKWTDEQCDQEFGVGKWERVVLPSEVRQEITSFSVGDGGVRIKKGPDKNKKAEPPKPSILPRHYMRYTKEPDTKEMDIRRTGSTSEVSG